jgi:hypothetical protein
MNGPPDGYFLRNTPQFRVMVITEETLEKRIQKIKHQIGKLGDLRPGALSQQYNVCGSPNCRCKAKPPQKHGPYYQISFRRHGKSSSQFVREVDLVEVQQQLENYRQLRELVDEWITVSTELSNLRLRQHRRNEIETPKLPIPKQKRNGRA